MTATSVLLSLCCAVLLFWQLLAWAAHGSAHWIERYSNAAGLSCCGHRDCYVVRARIISQDARQVTAEVNGIVLTLESGSVHTSEDTRDYACVVPATVPLTPYTVRCLFIATGM